MFAEGPDLSNEFMDFRWSSGTALRTCGASAHDLVSCVSKEKGAMVSRLGAALFQKKQMVFTDDAAQYFLTNTLYIMRVIIINSVQRYKISQKKKTVNFFRTKKIDF